MFIPVSRQLRSRTSQTNPPPHTYKLMIIIKDNEINIQKLFDKPTLIINYINITIVYLTVIIITDTNGLDNTWGKLSRLLYKINDLFIVADSEK